MDKGQEAKSYFEQGLNCAQAVALAFEKELGLDAESIKRLSVGFTCFRKVLRDDFARRTLVTRIRYISLCATII